MNQVTLIGNLCRDIELRKTVSDSFVGSTAIAVRRDRKNDEGEYDTDFFDVKLFGSQAEFASKYLRKGDKICISGRVQIRDYVNRDGVKGRAVEVLVNAIENLEGKTDETVEEKPSVSKKQPEKTVEKTVEEASEEISDDDLPF